jgi:hypothetical protein
LWARKLSAINLRGINLRGCMGCYASRAIFAAMRNLSTCNRTHDNRHATPSEGGRRTGPPLLQPTLRRLWPHCRVIHESTHVAESPARNRARGGCSPQGLTGPAGPPAAAAPPPGRAPMTSRARCTPPPPPPPAVARPGRSQQRPPAPALPGGNAAPRPARWQAAAGVPPLAPRPPPAAPGRRAPQGVQPGTAGAGGRGAPRQHHGPKNECWTALTGVGSLPLPSSLPRPLTLTIRVTTAPTLVTRSKH